MINRQLGYDVRVGELLDITSSQPFEVVRREVLRTPMKYFSTNVALLKLYVDASNNELVDLYKTHVAEHNKKILTDLYPNSGFDIFVPENVEFTDDFSVQMVNSGIKAEMLYYNSTNPSYSLSPSPYYMYPRSSISKTPLMLANSVGIIDCGYRGWLIGALRCLKLSQNSSSFVVNKHSRLLQICHPSLCPVFVMLVNETDLSSSERGEGGFGSTGVSGSI